MAKKLKIETAPVPGRRLIDRQEVKRKARLSDSTIDRKITEGVLPKPVSFGPRCIRWWEDEVDAALAALPRHIPKSHPNTPLPPRARAKRRAASEANTTHS